MEGRIQIIENKSGKQSLEFLKIKGTNLEMALRRNREIKENVNKINFLNEKYEFIIEAINKFVIHETILKSQDFIDKLDDLKTQKEIVFIQFNNLVLNHTFKFDLNLLKDLNSTFDLFIYETDELTSLKENRCNKNIVKNFIGLNLDIKFGQNKPQFD